MGMVENDEGGMTNAEISVAGAAGIAK